MEEKHEYTGGDETTKTQPTCMYCGSMLQTVEIIDADTGEEIKTLVGCKTCWSEDQDFIEALAKGEFTAIE